MALFFRKAQPKGSDDSPVKQKQGESSSVSRETGIKLPDGPRRAALERPQEEWASDRGDEHGTDREPQAPLLSLPRPAAPRVIVVANQKGGVGKTTTTVNIAAALAFGGLNVLVVDADPQGNASTALGIDHGSGVPGTYEVLLDEARIADLVQRSPHTPNLHVLPAAIELATAELELVNESGRETRMKKALAVYIDSSEVDYVLIDCPPSLGLLTLNALVGATEIMVPIQCEYYALEGVSQLVRTINKVKGNLNNSLELTTVVLTMFDARNNLSREVAGEVRKHFTKQTLDVEIPRSVRIAEAPSYGQTVLTYQPKSAGAIAYVKAAEQIATSALVEEDS